MSKQDDGGPAYPCVEETGETTEHVYSDSRCVTTEPVYRRHSGMTLRDWFAGQAMAAMLRNVTDEDGFRLWAVKEERAKRAYEEADAMLAARKETR